MWNEFGSGSYRGVDLVGSLHHKNYHNFFRKSYRLPAWHCPKVGDGPSKRHDDTIQEREMDEVGSKTAAFCVLFLTSMVRNSMFLTVLRRPVFVHRENDFARFCEKCEKLRVYGKGAKSAAPVRKNEAGMWATDAGVGNLASKVGRGSWPESGPILERNCNV